MKPALNKTYIGSTNRGFLNYLVLFLCIMQLLSCKIDHEATIQQGQGNPLLDSCRMETDHQYYISLPGDLHSGQKIPLIIVIDPHGDGFSAMQKFRDALKDFPVAIAGSTKLQNNYAGFEASLKTLHNDLLAKYPVDPQKVLVAGFSGGARMALYYGINHPVHGIIMFGAGYGPINKGVQQKQIYAVSGTRDFNFFEQYRPLFIDIPENSKKMNDYFRGLHNWPPERYIRETIVFCLRDGSSTYNALALKLSAEFLEESDSLQIANDLFFAGKALEKAWYFAAGNRQKSISAKIDAFERNPAWIVCQRKVEVLLKSEERIKQVFAANLVDPDTTWWSKEVNSLMTQIHDCSDPVEKDYYYRLKGFLGIYLYSQINTLLNSKNTSDLMDRLLQIYEQVEPDSEDLEKFRGELSQIRDFKR